MKNSKGLVLILLLLLIGGGLVMASIWGEARRKELAYEVFSTIDKFKVYIKDKEAEAEKISALEKKVLLQEKTIEDLKVKYETTQKAQEISTDKFASTADLKEVADRLTTLEKNNTTEKTKQILSLHTMANLRRALEDERGYGAELMALRKMYPKWSEWDILAKYADLGVPTFSSLTSSFYDLVKKHKEGNHPLEKKTEAKKWWSLVQSKISNLVRIEKEKLLTHDQTNEDIIARAGNALEQNNLRHAIDEVARLEMSDTNLYIHFKAWHGKATDRIIVLKIADEMMMRITAEMGE